MNSVRLLAFVCIYLSAGGERFFRRFSPLLITSGTFSAFSAFFPYTGGSGQADPRRMLFSWVKASKLFLP